jgi:NAD(P)-dependent dehydrogenase (short-subunit alcohol dehydrogenase family)
MADDAQMRDRAVEASRRKTAGPLVGKTALVTGASRGIGRATALRLAADGALVAVHYGKSQAEADEVVAAIIDARGLAFAVAADLRLPSSAEALFAALDAELVARTGTNALDVLVNNAGVGPRALIENVGEADLDHIILVNLKAAFLLIRAASSRLRRDGRITSVSSMATRRAFPELAAYAAAKAGLESLTLSLAQHFGPRGITVNAVLPGATATEMHPAFTDPEIATRIAGSIALGRMGKPNDIAEVIAFLASDAGRWITGQRIEVSGGQRL